MSEDDIPAEQTDDSSTTDAAETAVDGGAVATETPQSRFWGVVPSGWELVEGSEVYNVNPSYTPDEEEVTYIEMDALDTELPFPKYSKKRRAADYSGKLFREGDTLFARITPCTENGKTAFVGEMDTDVGIGSTEYAVLSPDRERIHPMYLFYVAKSHPVRNYAISRMRGSTGRQRVPFDVFRKELDIALPPLEEQKKIAAILFNLDKNLLSVQRVNKKFERLDKGLRQNLFTNGVGATEFQQSGTLGKIPAHWDTKTLADVAEITMGSSPKSEYYNENGDGLPFFQGKAEFGIRSPTHDRWCSDPVKTAEEDDILMTIRAPAGQLNVADRNCCIGRGLAAISPDNDLIQTEYLYHHLRRRERYIASIATGSTFDSVNTDDLETLEVAVPPKSEQVQIGETFQSIQDKYLNTQEYLSKLKSLKKGLMQDLLQGELRTDSIKIDVPEEITNYE
jgi:type I restriction enzyme S subunit